MGENHLGCNLIVLFSIKHNEIYVIVVHWKMVAIEHVKFNACNTRLEGLKSIPIYYSL